MHNKLLVADNRFAVSGGRNMADEYFMRSTAANFIDMDVISAGPVVRDLSAVFDRYWNSDHAYPVAAVVALRARVGINAGDVLVRSIASDLHMDYTAIGETTHMAAKVEQLAAPGTICATADLVRLVEGPLTLGGRRALLLESANDAAATLAVGVAGSRPAFVRQMMVS